MKDTYTCYLNDKMKEKQTHYFGFRLIEIVSITALSVSGEEYLRNYQSRMETLLNCLLKHNDAGLTYELRMISYPDSSFFTRGKIAIYLLCKISHADSIDAENNANQLFKLLRSLLIEYEFEQILSSELSSVLKPFEFNSITEIKRRYECVQLDSIDNSVRSKEIGFTINQKCSTVNNTSNGKLTYFFPFISTQGSFEYLFNQLLLEDTPVMISIMLQPTKFEDEQRKFFEDQIVSCERFAQTHINNVSGRIDNIYPTLQEKARLYQRELAKIVNALKGSSAYMQIRLASPNRLHEPIINMFGNLITEPAGGKYEIYGGNISPHLSGGYKSEIITGKLLKQSKRSLEKMELVFNNNDGLPSVVNSLLYIFDSREAMSAFRFPPSTVESLPGVKMRHWRLITTPENLPKQGTLIGCCPIEMAKQLIHISDEDKRRHVYIVGQTGTGKTTMLKTMILSDIQAGKGVCVIDPHGDMYKEILGKIPTERINDVALIDPTDVEFPVGLNMLEYELIDQRYFLVQEMTAIITKLVLDEYGHDAAGFMGPMFFQHMRMNMLLAMSDPNDPGTLLEFYSIFFNRNYWKRWLPLKIEEPLLKWWTEETLTQTDYTKPGSDGTAVGSYIGSKFEPFIFDPLLRYIFAQKRSSINIRQIMDSGKILLVNLAKGELTEANSRFLGMVLLAKIQAAAMERVRIPHDQRRIFNIYVDEFQSIATQNFITLLSEGRKFGVNLVLANQFINQINPNIMSSILGNVGTIVCFRIGPEDAEDQEKLFFPLIKRSDLLNLPNWYAYVSTQIQGRSIRPFIIKTLQHNTPTNLETAMKVIDKSRTLYGRQKAEVELVIKNSFVKVTSNSLEQDNIQKN